MRSIFTSCMIARLVLFCAIALCFCLPFAHADKPENIKKVLILFPEEGWSAPAYRTIYNAIKSVFDENPKNAITLFGESLDLYLFPDEQTQRNIADFLKGKYGNMKIDLVIPVAPASLNFLLRFRNRLFTGMPVVYCGEVA